MTPKFMNEEFAIWKTSLQYIKGSHTKMHSNVAQFQILGWSKDMFFVSGLQDTQIAGFT